MPMSDSVPNESVVSGLWQGCSSTGSRMPCDHPGCLLGSNASLVQESLAQPETRGHWRPPTAVLLPDDRLLRSDRAHPGPSPIVQLSPSHDSRLVHRTPPSRNSKARRSGRSKTSSRCCKLHSSATSEIPVRCASECRQLQAHGRRRVAYSIQHDDQWTAASSTTRNTTGPTTLRMIFADQSCMRLAVSGSGASPCINQGTGT
ncbi:uncharacterized protein B0H18DRAFT_1031164 [Fomitopsis serialis]|uniref:uncharacterized protein n=1 Tax=Fomitopsis serialis TaxID=139415 RepID=UPI002007E6B0|nr:uncharacterized protein B0H18DRAFT_1031123 [Neoantrodia serialis]XP_047888998.1 uncharacterized protein B0H18DRAFT_1031164 [Neoantrodia serialis]KAH9918509.1 hypothetical protein B0H18DRAFT_1031123 [Neoantrodia serialis]KAH9918511.1 hypothetical protein B0H18DRAFT_1031164 [Neoantrodia serialis]